MIHFFKNRLVFTALAAAILTTNISVQAMELNQPEILEAPKNIFADELALVQSENYFKITKLNMPQLYAMLQDLALKFDIPTPIVYVFLDKKIWARTDGDDQSISLSTGLLQQRVKGEIEFVIAHEFSHIKNKDIQKTGPHIFYSVIIAIIFYPIVYFLDKNYIGIGDYSHTESFIMSAVYRIFLMTFVIMQYFQRCQETEADLLAVKTLRSPDAAISFFRKEWGDEYYIQKFLPTFIRSHPPTETRIKYIENAFQKQD